MMNNKYKSANYGKTRLRIAMIGLKGIPAKWGGMEKYVEEIGKRLVQRGHEVTVFGSKWYCADAHNLNTFGMRVRPLPTLHAQATDALSNALIASLLIIAGRFDVVHMHGYASYFFIPLLKTFGKKCVITAHGVESGWDNPKYSSFARNVVKKAYMTGLTKADAVTTVAEHLSRTIRTMSEISAQVMPSGLDEVTSLPPRIIAEKHGLRGNDFLLFLGRIDPIKRADWLLDLADIVGPNLKIVIAGGAQDAATDAYYQEMRRRASGDARIIFTGPVTGAEKSELLSNCFCMIAPSQYEGLPITVLEAASYSRCCLASDIPAHREIIVDGQNGFLFSSGSKDDFFRSMQRILALPADALPAIGAEANRTGMQTFNWEMTTDLFITLYRNLAGDRHEEH